WMRDCAPAADSDVFEWLGALDDVTAAPATADKHLADTCAFLRDVPDKAGAPRKVFVFNSENDADLPQLRLRPGLDTAFVLASGFKANRVLEAVGFHDATKVITYDYSAPALALRKLTIEEWDGRNYGAFFLAARPRIDRMFEQQVSYLPPAVLND